LSFGCGIALVSVALALGIVERLGRSSEYVKFHRHRTTQSRLAVSYPVPSLARVLLFRDRLYRLESARRAFVRQGAARALGDAGFADLATVGDQEHVHFVAIIFGDEIFHDRMRLVGSRFFFDETQPFRNAMDVRVDRECWHSERKRHYYCSSFWPDARKRCEPFSSFFEWFV